MRTIVLVILIAGLAGCGGSSGNNNVAQTPLLDALSVSGGKSPLNPPFDPTNERYAIVAQDTPASSDNMSARAATEPLVINVSAVDGLLISVLGELISGDMDIPLDGLEPGDIIDILVENKQGASRRYEIQYLPSDFPVLTTTVLEEGVSPGLVYFSFSGPGKQYVAIVDNHGVPVFYRGENQRVTDFKLHPNGQRSYAVRTGENNQCDRAQTEQVILGPDFEEIRRVTTVDLTHTDPHDFLILDDENYIAMAYDCNVRDATAYGGDPEQVVEDSVIQEVDSSGQVVFEWNSWEKMGIDDQIRPHPTDYAHINSIWEDFDNNLIVSARSSSQVAKIDRVSGEVLWRLGGKSNQFAFVDDPFSHLCGQHTASRLDSGNILIFDNGQYCWPEDESRGEMTRVVEYELDLDAMTATLVWSYSHESAYSRAAGGAQRLANDNTMIGWGRSGDIVATEVDAGGDKVFEMTATVDGEAIRSYRARRFSE